MTTEPRKPKSLCAPGEMADGDVPFRDQPADDWPDAAWIERNKDALAKSIRQADGEFARGEFYTHEEVLAHLETDRRRRVSES